MTFTMTLPFGCSTKLLLSVLIASLICVASKEHQNHEQQKRLRFGSNGEFKIIQVADMHFADGKSTPCLNVLPSQVKACSDLNTSAFIHRMIEAEKPNLVIFTGDNIFGFDATDAAKSLDAAFAPAISSNVPWAAVLGNHDQESTLSREGVMKHIVGMNNTLSQLNPSDAEFIDGFGNYNLEVGGVPGSGLENKSALNLYFFDSGDYSTVPSIPGYGYHAYGKAGWSRRARVVAATLEKLEKGGWGGVKSIKTWKRLDDKYLTAIDGQVLWSKRSSGIRRKKQIRS